MKVEIKNPHAFTEHIGSVGKLRSMEVGSRLVIALYVLPQRLPTKVPYGILVSFAIVDGLAFATYERTKKQK